MLLSWKSVIQKLPLGLHYFYICERFTRQSSKSQNTCFWLFAKYAIFSPKIPTTNVMCVDTHTHINVYTTIIKNDKFKNTNINQNICKTSRTSKHHHSYSQIHKYGYPRKFSVNNIQIPHNWVWYETPCLARLSSSPQNFIN